MSKTKIDSTNLPSLQHLIVRHFTESEPETINQTSKELKKQYKATHCAFESLIKKGIICQKNIYEWRGQKFPKYWLTNQGVLSALLSEMDTKKFTKNIEQFSNFGANAKPIVFLANALQSDSANVRTIAKEMIKFLLSMMTEGESSDSNMPLEETEKMIEEQTKFFHDLQEQFPSMSKLIVTMIAVLSMAKLFLKDVPKEELQPIEEIAIATVDENSANNL